ncbi:MAG TPA: M1 family aminopeptidase, partial [Pyrinomonadaceae bacterium]|nr:M1 family aminopeptidase [Pyrinomonadaceae bacterium]
MKFLRSLRSIIVLYALAALFTAASAQIVRPDLNRVRTYDVQHYLIRVKFDRPAKKVLGDTTVTLTPLKPLSQIVLDSAGIKYDSVSLDSEGPNLQFTVAGEKITVDLPRTYQPGETIAIRFKYSAVPTKGVYFVPEQIENGIEMHSAQIWTQGEAEEARHWFPSFDFPSDKATTEQYITANDGETVIANGEFIDKIKNSDGTITHHFKMTVPHSTYLLSFVIGKYSVTSDKYGDVPLGYYVYPGKEPLVPKAFGITKDVLRVYEELTGVKFPYNKYDQTIVAGFTFGGMENITATTLADSEVFLANFDFGKSTVEDLVSHEAAHSWFG